MMRSFYKAIASCLLAVSLLFAPSLSQVNAAKAKPQILFRPGAAFPSGFQFFGSGSFDLNSLPDIAWRYDFSDASTITLNTTDIAQVNDLSAGTARPGTQPTTSAQPLYALASINGLNTASLDAINNDALLVQNGTSYTQDVAVVWIMGVVSIPATPAATSPLFTATISNASNGRFRLDINTSNQPRIQTRRVTADATMTSTFVLLPISAATPHFFYAVCDYVAASCMMQIDSSAQTIAQTWASGAGNTENLPSNQPPTIGRVGGATFAGQFGEIVSGAGSTAPSVLQVAQAYAFFKAKWSTP